MSEIIRCTRCDRSLRVPAQALGKQLKCPHCGNMFAAKAPPRSAPGARPLVAPAPPEDDLEEVKPTSGDPTAAPKLRFFKYRKEDEANWRRVNTGLVLIVVAIGLSLVGEVFQVFYVSTRTGSIEAAQRANPGNIDTIRSSLRLSRTFQATGLSLILLARVILIAGNVACLFVPAENNAKFLAIVAVAVIGISLLFLCVGGAGLLMIIADRSAGPKALRREPGLRALVEVGWVLYWAQVIVVVFFLRAVAQIVDSQWLARQAPYLAILAGATALVSCGLVIVDIPDVFNVVTRNQAGVLDSINWLLLLGKELLTLAVLGWYVFLLLQVRQAVVKYLSPPPTGELVY
jgi:hypothetical protein